MTSSPFRTTSCYLRTDKRFFSHFRHDVSRVIVFLSEEQRDVAMSLECDKPRYQVTDVETVVTKSRSHVKWKSKAAWEQTEGHGAIIGPFVGLQDL